MIDFEPSYQAASNVDESLTNTIDMLIRDQVTPKIPNGYKINKI